jgi:hypothetical protein
MVGEQAAQGRAQVIPLLLAAVLASHMPAACEAAPERDTRPPMVAPAGELFFPPCPSEDSPGAVDPETGELTACHWDGASHGNGQGWSFIVIPTGDPDNPDIIWLET